MSTDPFSMLEQDHRDVEAILHALSAADPASGQDRVSVLARLTQALRVHMDFEEREIYPLVASTIDVAEAHDRRDEHQAVRADLARLEALTGDEQFLLVLAEMQAAIGRHVGVEESVLFPRLREAVGSAEQEHLSESLAAVRETAS